MDRMKVLIICAERCGYHPLHGPVMQSVPMVRIDRGLYDTARTKTSGSKLEENMEECSRLGERSAGEGGRVQA